jgi:hypothetical protein
MSEHRLRLDDDDVELLMRGLAARLAMLHGMRRHRAERLLQRLSDLGRGNPQWRLDVYAQVHENDLREADSYVNGTKVRG